LRDLKAQEYFLFLFEKEQREFEKGASGKLCRENSLRLFSIIMEWNNFGIFLLDLPFDRSGSFY